MDKHQALSILGLPVSADLETARAAFRRLAKQHHPDRFARDPAAAAAAEARMKRINLAYRHLLPLLSAPKKQKPKAGPISGKARGRKGIWGRLAAFFNRPARPRPPSFNPSSARGAKRFRTPSNQRYREPRPRFKDFFDPPLAGFSKPSQKGFKKRMKAAGQTPYANYLRYMDLKKQTENSRRIREIRGMGRVEKISGVKPVNRVDRK